MKQLAINAPISGSIAQGHSEASRVRAAHTPGATKVNVKHPCTLSVEVVALRVIPVVNSLGHGGACMISAHLRSLITAVCTTFRVDIDMILQDSSEDLLLSATGYEERQARVDEGISLERKAVSAHSL